MAESEFSELMRAEAAPAYRLAYTMLRDAQYAEDAVQDAALKAWSAMHKLGDRQSFRAWFLAIVANECRQVHRRRWWRLGRASIGDLPEAILPADVVDTHTSLDLTRAVADLGREDRLALYLYYYLDLRVEEAATSMSCSASAFRSRLARATKRMRPAMAGYGGTDG